EQRKGRPEPRRSPVASWLSLYDASIMTNLVRYLTHPQVQIDPAVPVPLWGLNEVGRGRTEAILGTGRLLGTTQIISSGERKATETAEIIGAKLNVDVEVR